MMLTVAFLLAVVIGVSVGLLGGGGSILTVPMLAYVFHVAPREAIAISLFTVGTTSLVGMASHASSGRVDPRVGLPFGAAGMAGATLSSRLARGLDGHLVLMLFGLVMLVTAIAMLRGRGAPRAAAPSLPKAMLMGVGVGVLAGLVGAGGGFLVVPALVLFGGLPMTRAVGTSLLVITMQSAAGFAMQATQAPLPWTLALVVTGGSVTGALLGVKLTAHILPDRLRKGFAWLVLVMATLQLGKELSSLYFAMASKNSHSSSCLARASSRPSSMSWRANSPSNRR